MSLAIFYPNGQVEAVQVFIWDGTKPILWDGTVTATFSGTIGTVAQGDPAVGSKAWPIAVTEDTTNTIVHPGDDTNKAIRVNVVAGSGGNSAASATGSAVPASADYQGLNVGGTLRGQTGVNPSGVIYAAQTDITTIGGASVVSAAAGIMKVGVADGSGNAITSHSSALDISIRSQAAALTVDGSGVTQPVSGTVTAVQSTASNLKAQITGAGSAGSADTGVVTVQGIASMTALKVDGSAATQPVSGTVSVTGVATASNQTGGGQKTQIVDGSGNVIGATSNALDINIKSGNPTSIAVTQSTSPWIVAGGGTAGSAATGVVTIQGIASMTKLLVTPDANSAVNVAQLAGTTTDTNSGNKSAGTLRVVIATDQPQLANKLLVTPDANSTVIVDAGNTGGWSSATGSIGATKTDIGTANTAGQVGGWYFYNPNSSVAYVQFFNTQASGVTLGSTSPVYSLGIPATSAANVQPGAVGIAHATAISIAITTTRAGSTGPSSTVDYNIWFKQ